MRRCPTRNGFGVLWVIMIVALLAVVAAAAAPYLAQLNDVDRVNETATALRKVATAIDSFNLTAKRGGTSWTTPNNLALLTVTVVNGQPAGCTTLTYNATSVTAWATGAPYAPFFMPTDGLWTPLGRINNAPSRVTTAPATARTSINDPYYIQIPNVDVRDARMLDLAVDGTINNAADTVLYTAPAADSTVLLSYNVFPAHLPAC